MLLATISRAVTLLRLDAADRLEFAGLDDAQQDRLLLQAERVDLVQQNGSLADGGELADLGSIGAGEGPLGMAEQFAFDQVGGQSAAGNGQKTVIAAAANIVNEPGQVRLAACRFRR